MSVKANYQNLQEKRETIRRNIREYEEKLKQYKQNHGELLKKREEFLQRSSQLAKKLQCRICEEICKIEREIQEVTENLNKIREELKYCEEMIDKLEKEPTEYIAEQTDFLVKGLLGFISENELKLGTNIKTCFYICYEKKNVDDCRGVFCCPTGIVEIDWEKGMVVKSKDFYFNNSLYTKIYAQDDGRVIVKNTEWFNWYMELFNEKLRRKIDEAFKEHPNFKVNFTGKEKFAQFTIELR